MVNLFIRLITLFILTSLIVIQPAFALTKVTATVDKNPVIERESFVLEVTADDDISSDALDTSPLMKDFMVGRTSVSSQTSMVNYNTTRTTKWTTVLIPRAVGEFTIPPLNINTLATQPIALKVLKQTSSAATQPKDIFITSDISSNTVYVQQQLTLTIKLFFAAELKRGSLTEPTLDGAAITQIGKDTEKNDIINGKRYRVIERSYAINPQNSGEFIIKTPLFSGEILTGSARRNSFFSTGNTKPITVLGEDINITVKPIPDNYQGVWLPSEILTLHQEWQPNTNTFMVGEPITRTITLSAAGLSEEQLPTIQMNVPTGLKSYPDQAELHTGMNKNRFISQKKQNFALVASQVGTFELPEISVPWWNTVTNRVQYAVIPAQTITITPNNDPTTLATSDDSAENNVKSTLESTENLSQDTVKTITVTKSSWLQWLFLLLWLATSFAWFLSTRLTKTKVSLKTDPENTQYYKKLIKACEQNSGEQVLKLIVPWANTLFTQHNIATLADAKKVINNSEFECLLNAIQHSIYAKDVSPWQGNELKLCIVKINKQPHISHTQLMTINP